MKTATACIVLACLLFVACDEGYTGPTCEDYRDEIVACAGGYCVTGGEGTPTCECVGAALLQGLDTGNCTCEVELSLLTHYDECTDVGAENYTQSFDCESWRLGAQLDDAICSP